MASSTTVQGPGTATAAAGDKVILPGAVGR